jgi:hypothetical protein
MATIRLKKFTIGFLAVLTIPEAFFHRQQTS